MIVVAIISLLAAIALPSLLRAREQTRRAKFAAALRVARDACEIFASENNAWPADVSRGILPPAMATYFSAHHDWSAPTPIGGRWDWDFRVYGFTAGVSVILPNESQAEMAEVDRLVDDGDLTTGAFQETAPARYTWILER